jgi:predicted RNA-binding Zn-ribbon protein involved in translation (DUF1610 family)
MTITNIVVGLMARVHTMLLNLFIASPDEVAVANIKRNVHPQPLCPKCGEAMERGQALVQSQNTALPFLYPHEIPTFLRPSQTGPAFTQNPFTPTPLTVYRCPACGFLLDSERS